MPLREVEFSPDAVKTLKDGKEKFLVFFSSRRPGSNVPWCPDCQAVEDLIRNTFNSEPQAPSAVLIYVGQASEWKTPSNIFRKEPWKVQSIPTIIKLGEDGKEIGRLVDGQNYISDELPSFIR